MSEYTVKIYTELTSAEKENFFNFCKEASHETKNSASVNMWSWDNPNAKNTIFYKLENTEYFKEPNGTFFILFFNNDIVGCSGVYRSNFSKDIFIAGARTWIKTDFRNKSLNKEYFFPLQKQWVRNNNGKIIALTFNHYNKNIITIFKRNRIGEKNNRIPGRKINDLFYDNFNEVEFSVNINNTEQWVCFEKLDPDFCFDWESIKYNH
jgi:hypothetical protein